jgi:arylsulfatase A-like enzyme
MKEREMVRATADTVAWLLRAGQLARRADGARPARRDPRSRMRLRLLSSLWVLMFGLLACSSGDEPQAPNILFVIMDDVGIDQMRLFGYGGETPPNTPTIDRIASAGIRFTNTWSMPACSTSRAVFFSGRFPLRTNVLGALGPSDLANSMVSPFETSLPKLLKPRGYHSALFGKFHLGLQGNSPYSYAMPRSLGWDYFEGWLDESGDPSSIDRTAGGVAAGGATYACGFVPGAAQGGADSGACYASSGSCQPMKLAAGVPPGRTCRDAGGIFDPNQSCVSPRPANIDFQTLSAHYVSPLVINDEQGGVLQVPPTDPRARTYRGSGVVDAAIAWIQSQPKNRPWMASVSFSSAHTPVMQPPQALLSSDPAATSALSCSNAQAVEQRVLTDLMIEALDTEIGRLLVATGLASRDTSGSLVYEPEAANTMLVILGDNGTLGSSVKLPFDASRAKGTAYQTGVWVPLVVAGPLVSGPSRAVAHMVNVADLYQLFGEIAGIDVPASVPRMLDATSMLPYLKDPAQPGIRSWNFTQVAPNLQANGTLNGPCAISTSCTQIPVTKSVCEDNAGTWWGAGATAPATQGIPAAGFQYCCQVNEWQAARNAVTYALQPLGSVAVRNDRYKLVRNSFVGNPEPDAQNPPNCVAQQTNEFYAIDEGIPLPRIDRKEFDLNKLPSLTPEQQSNYDTLSARLQQVLDSQPLCPGDGNIDGIVNGKDDADARSFVELSEARSSWYDMNQDGLTDALDLQIVSQNLGRQCSK